MDGVIHAIYNKPTKETVWTESAELFHALRMVSAKRSISIST
jgi:hypothetical protein